MKIKMRTLMCGPDGNAQPGEEIDVAQWAGKALTDGGYADEIKRRKGETAMLAPRENAALTPTAEEASRATLAKIAAAAAAAELNRK